MIIPALGTFLLFALLIWSIKVYVDPNQSYVEVNLPLIGEVGGTLLIAAITVIVGLEWMLASSCAPTALLPGTSPHRRRARRSGRR